MPREPAPEGRTSDNPAAPERSPPVVTRAARLAGVLEDVVTQRLAGRVLSDELVLAQHPHLQPELAAKLADLRCVEPLVAAEGSSFFAPSGLLSGVDDLPGDGPGPVLAGLLPGYELIREIHRGGQGVVFEARQKSTKRHVAVKVLFGGALGGVHTRERFLREIEIQAGLTHPNIVAIHDSGAVSGLLYFVMDYIPGQGLDAYVVGRWGKAAPSDKTACPHRGAAPISCNNRVRGILDLFVQVCDAVNAAHVQGVIHRDLKPSNVRVDADGKPHVLDFGLAKLTAPGEPGSSAVGGMTQTGQFVGSLPWAAPEQAGGKSAQIDTRTDVYALGVVLYQLLTGAFPYDVTGPVRDVMGRIVEKEPTRPRTLCHGIDNEVETLLLKCLSKDRERRYQNAGDLARDIRRYLADEPLEAKRDSTFYVVRKTLGRHRVALAVAVAFVAILATSTVVAWTLYARSEERGVLLANDRDEIAKERDRALKAEQDSAALNKFFNDTLAYGGSVSSERRPLKPIEKPAAEITARDLLQYMAARVEEGFPDKPALAANIRMTLSQAFSNMGCYADAQQQACLAMELRRDALGPDDGKTLGATNLCACGLVGLGRITEALELTQLVYEGYLRSLGPENCGSLNAEMNIGVYLRVLGRLSEAELVFRKLLETHQHVDCQYPFPLLYLNCNLSQTLVLEGRLQEAEAFPRELIYLSGEVPPDQIDDELANAQWWLADVLREQGRYAEAEAALQTSLTYYRRASGERHPSTLYAMSNLMMVHAEQGGLDEAKDTLRSVRFDLLNAGTENVFFESAVAVKLARVLTLRGDFSEAEDLLRETLPRLQAKMGEDSMYALDQRDQLTVALRGLGRLAEAEKNGREVVEAAERVFPDGRYYYFPQFRTHWGRCLTDLNRFEEAEPQLLASYDGELAMRGPEHRYTRESLANLVHLYETWDLAEPGQGHDAQAAACHAKLPTPPPAKTP